MKHLIHSVNFYVLNNLTFLLVFVKFKIASPRLNIILLFHQEHFSVFIFQKFQFRFLPVIVFGRVSVKTGLRGIVTVLPIKDSFFSSLLEFTNLSDVQKIFITNNVV